MGDAFSFPIILSWNKRVPESLAAKKPRIVRGKAKYDDARLSLRHFKNEKKCWKRKRTNSNHVRYGDRHKQSQANYTLIDF